MIPGTEKWTINECLDFIDHDYDVDDGYNDFTGMELEMLKDGNESYDDDWYAD